MFRFSKWLNNRKDLDGWEKWFKSRGIATEIKPEGSLLALFRDGEEAKMIEQKQERRKI